MEYGLVEVEFREVGHHQQGTGAVVVRRGRTGHHVAQGGVDVHGRALRHTVVPGQGLDRPLRCASADRCPGEEHGGHGRHRRVELGGDLRDGLAQRAIVEAPTPHLSMTDECEAPDRAERGFHRRRVAAGRSGGRPDLRFEHRRFRLGRRRHRRCGRHLRGEVFEDGASANVDRGLRGRRRLLEQQVGPPPCLALHLDRRIVREEVWQLEVASATRRMHAVAAVARRRGDEVVGVREVDGVRIPRIGSAMVRRLRFELRLRELRLVEPRLVADQQEGAVVVQ